MLRSGNLKVLIGKSRLKFQLEVAGEVCSVLCYSTLENANFGNKLFLCSVAKIIIKHGRCHVHRILAFHSILFEPK